MGFLFDSGTDTVPTSSTSTVKLPAWLDQGGQDTYNFASDIASTPYQGYEGPRIAPLTPNETAGITMAGNTGSWAPAVGAAGEMFDGATRGIAGTDLSAYMNPYEDDVIASVMNDLGRSHSYAIRDAGDEAAFAGAFGGSRQGVREGEADRALIDAMGRESSSLRAGGYDRAVAAATGDLNREAALGGQYMQLGALVPELQGNDIGRLMATGAVERGVDQSNLDLGYADFLEERGWPVRNLAILQQGLGVPAGQTTTTNGTQTIQSPSVFGQAAGAGLAAYGLWG